MRLPRITGLIRRRLLVNYRVDPRVMQRLLPAPFRPKLHDGQAIAGICLIRLENIRPAGLPAWMGVSSENAAHRIAVQWEDEAGHTREGVFIPRRDTGSRLNSLAGGRIFPAEHHHATFTVRDDGTRVDLAMQSDDRSVHVRVQAAVSDALPASSSFRSVAVASAFFEGGCVGYSVKRNSALLDGLLLRTLDWRVQPLAVERVESSWFSDRSLFPEGSAHFDHALIMRDLAHEWHDAGTMKATPGGSFRPSATAETA